MSDLGTVFPPRDEWDIAAYPQDDCVAGYRDYRPDDVEPGPNHAPGYRWGWVNRRRDHTSKTDGFDHLRSAYIAMTRLAS